MLPYGRLRGKKKCLQQALFVGKHKQQAVSGQFDTDRSALSWLADGQRESGGQQMSGFRTGKGMSK